MNRFAIAQARTYQEASTLVKDKRFKLPLIKAGGMDVIDHLKEGLVEPDALINIRSIKPTGEKIRQGMEKIHPPFLVIEATATLSEIVTSELLGKWAPVLGQSLERAATPQVRNVGTAAGNLLQRPRCWYYRNEQFNCLKKGGGTCFAVDGENQYHAIFGGGPCHIVHPSNLAPALIVCDGHVHLTGGARERVAVADLFHLPDKGVKSEHNLEPGEVITHIQCHGRPHSGFYTIKEKQSFDWPLAMCAVSLQLNGEVITQAQVCTGAVAPVPWPLPEVAEALKGVSINDEASIGKAAMIAADNAAPMSQNSYKLKLLPVAVKRAVLRAAGQKVEA